MFNVIATEGYDWMETDEQSKEGGRIGGSKSENEGPLDTNSSNIVQEYKVYGGISGWKSFDKMICKRQKKTVCVSVCSLSFGEQIDNSSGLL